MTITNARVLSPERVFISGPTTDARIIETRPPVASAPVTMRNPDEGPSATTRPVMVAGPTPDALVIEAEPLPTTALEQTEPTGGERQRRRRS